MPDISAGRRPTLIEMLESRRLLTALPAGFVDTTVAHGLNVPTTDVIAPDGRIFIAEKGGNLKIIKNGVIQKKPFLTLAVDTYSERGLDGVALDPNFESNGYVYVYYTTADPLNPNTTGNTAHNRLSRFTVSGSNPDRADTASELVLLDNIASTNGNHNGGSMVFGGDGMLYLGIGEAGVRSNAQDLTLLNGKVLRLDASHPSQLIPTDNPFYNDPTARKEIYDYGFRNPFSSAFDPITGQIYINDVGSSGTAAREEVNLLFRGGNYGWPNVEGIVRKDGYLDPQYAYPHSGKQGNAITGGVFYNGTQLPPKWQGKYFFSDFVGNFIHTLDPFTLAEVDFATGVDSPVHLDNAPDGGLYYLSVNGSLHEIHSPGPDVTGPYAALTSAPRLRGRNVASYSFTVTYTDATAVNLPSLRDGNLLVAGPKGFSRLAQFVSATPSTNNRSIVATYSLSSSVAVWDSSFNGIYTITLIKRQVRDVMENPSPAQVLGQFSVRIPAA